MNYLFILLPWLVSYHKTKNHELLSILFLEAKDEVEHIRILAKSKHRTVKQKQKEAR